MDQINEEDIEDENPSLSEDDIIHLLNRLNETIHSEVGCELKKKLAKPIFGCPVDFDTVLCWPQTLPNSTAILPCFDQLNGIKYDIRENASRQCFPNGSWSTYTNYTACRELSQLEEPEVEITTTIYFIGYTLSLIALIVAVYIFWKFKDLRCLRNTIHMNLMCSYILADFMWIFVYSLQGPLQANKVFCIFLIIFLHYFHLTNFFWMFVEGLYLYILVVKTFTGENIKPRIYALIGWGLNPLKLRYVPITIFLTALSTVTVLTVIGFVKEEPSFENMISLISTVGAITHMILKYSVLTIKRKDVLDIINDIENKYWPIPSESENQKEFFSILKVWMFLTRAVNFYYVLSMVLIPISQIFGGERAFPCYVPEFAPKYFPNILDMLLLYSATPFVTGIDCLVSILFVLLRVQFKILNEKIKTFTYDKVTPNDFKRVMLDSYIKQHAFLKRKNSELARPIAMFCAACFELLLYYFLPTHLLLEEASRTSESFFNSDWYLCPHIKIKKFLLFLTVTTQQNVKILAGDWIPMNMATCLLIYRTTFSFYTFIQNIHKKKI